MPGLLPEQQEAWKRKVRAVDAALRLALDNAGSAKASKSPARRKKIGRAAGNAGAVGRPQPLGGPRPVSSA